MSDSGIINDDDGNQQEQYYQQMVASAIIPKIFSSLSILGSSYIIYKSFKNILSKQRDNIQRVRDRIFIALSICDMIASCAYFISTWAIPEDDGQNLVVFNIGNQNTCNIQGFMIQFGAIGAAFYNTFLSVYFYICVREGGRNIKILKKIEPIFHLFSIGFPLGTAIVGLTGGNFNTLTFGCWISEYPRNCVGEECIRGENAKRLQVFGMILPLITCILIISISMLLLYRAVKRQEETMTSYTRRWSARPSTLRSSIFEAQQINQGRPRSRSDNVWRQAVLYISAFASVWTPLIVNFGIVNKFFGDRRTLSFYVRLIGLIFVPLQGFFNALIYTKYNPIRRSMVLVSSALERISDLIHSTIGRSSITTIKDGNDMNELDLNETDLNETDKKLEQIKE